MATTGNTRCAGVDVVGSLQRYISTRSKSSDSTVGNGAVCCRGVGGIETVDDKEVGRIDQEVTGLAMGRQGVNGAGNADLPTAQLHLAAIAACGAAACKNDAARTQTSRSAFHQHLTTVGNRILCRGVQCPTVADRPLAFKDDLAVMLNQPLCLDDAGVVDDGAGQVACGLGGHDDRATIGLDDPLVGDQGIDGCGVDVQVDEVAPLHVEGDLVAGGQSHGAERPYDDAPFVGNVRSQEGDQVLGGDGTLVQYAAGCAAVTERILARHEVGVGHVQGGGHQATDAHLGGAAEQDAVGVQEEHVAVGSQATEDVGGVVAQHAVQRGGRRTRLGEVHPLASRDVEPLPVKNRILRALRDLHVGAALRDVGSTDHYRPVGRQCHGMPVPHRCQHQTANDPSLYGTTDFS